MNLKKEKIIIFAECDNHKKIPAILTKQRPNLFFKTQVQIIDDYHTPLFGEQEGRGCAQAQERVFKLDNRLTPKSRRVEEECESSDNQLLTPYTYDQSLDSKHTILPQNLKKDVLKSKSCGQVKEPEDETFSKTESQKDQVMTITSTVDSSNIDQATSLSPNICDSTFSIPFLKDTENKTEDQLQCGFSSKCKSLHLSQEDTQSNHTYSKCPSSKTCFPNARKSKFKRMMSLNIDTNATQRADFNQFSMNIEILKDDLSKDEQILSSYLDQVGVIQKNPADVIQECQRTVASRIFKNKSIGIQEDIETILKDRPINLNQNLHHSIQLGQKRSFMSLIKNSLQPTNNSQDSDLLLPNEGLQAASLKLRKIQRTTSNNQALSRLASLQDISRIPKQTQF